MTSRTSQSRVALSSLSFCASALMIVALPQTAHSQEASATDSSTGNGIIIYSRDVNHDVGDPYFPGTPHSVQTGPAATVLDALNVGLTPLSDLEVSGVSASMAPPQTNVQHTLEIGTEPLHQTIGSGLNNEHSGSIIGGTISSGMASLGSALGSVGSALGSIQNLGGAGQ